MSSSTLFIRSDMCGFWLFWKAKLTMKSKCFKVIRDIGAAMTAQPKTLRKRASSAAAEGGKDGGIHVLETGGLF